MRTVLCALVTVAVGLACGGGFTPQEGAWEGATPSAFVEPPGTERVTDIAWLPDGTLAALTDVRPDRHLEVRFLDPRGASARPTIQLEGVYGASAIASSPDGQAVLVPATGDLLVVPIDGSPPSRVRFADPSESPSACSGSWRLVRSGSLVASQCTVGYALGLVDLGTGWVGAIDTRDPDGRSVTVDGVAISPDGRWLAASGQSAELLGERRTDAWVEIRDVAAPTTGRRIPVRIGGEPVSGGVAFSPDGSRLVVTSPYWGFEVLDVATGAVLVEQPGARDHDDICPGGVAWTDQAILRVGRRCAIEAHDPSTGAVLGWFAAHTEEPARPYHPTPAGWPEALSHRNERFAISPDGRTLASYERQDWLPTYPIRMWTLAP